MEQVLPKYRAKVNIFLQLCITMHTLLFVAIEFAAVAHLMMSFVLFYFAQRNVSYKSQAWIMLIFAVMYSLALFYVSTSGIPEMDMLHPVLLIYLMVCSYLQSIYPLGLCMPGYLQWGRMWSYATPALLLIAIYSLGTLFGSSLTETKTFEDVIRHFLHGDIILRIATLVLSGYYIVNIFRLPHRLVRQFSLPADLVAYASALGMVSIFFVGITLNFNLVALVCYILAFTCVNMFLFFRVLRPIAHAMAYPQIVPVEAPPAEETLKISELEDFNEANLHRFQRIEYMMQNEKPFLDSLFNRERLCRLAGYNRHVVLQVVRSQGYNDIHEYIARYRVSELRRRIDEGEISDLKRLEQVGFRTLKTAQKCFELYENEELIGYLEKKLGRN